MRWTEHWTVFCTGAEHWAEKQNFRRKKDIVSARGVEIETRLRANCNSHVKNRRTTGEQQNYNKITPRLQLTVDRSVSARCQAPGLSRTLEIVPNITAPVVAKISILKPL